MGYSVRYEPELDAKFPVSDCRIQKRKFTAPVVAAVFVILTLCLVPVRKYLMEFLIPGDAALTQAAFCAFVDDVKAGKDLGESVTVFCQEIISHG